MKNLQHHLAKKEIMLLVGPRQAGKTTLMNMLRSQLEEKREQTLFLSLDFEENKKYFISQRAFLDKIKLEFGGQKGFIFIDEI